MNNSNKELISNLQNAIKDLKKIQGIREQILADVEAKQKNNSPNFKGN